MDDELAPSASSQQVADLGHDALLDDALPRLALAAERGLLTHSQIHKLHSFVEAVRNAPAYETAFPPPVSLSRVLRGGVSPQSQSFISRLPNEIMVEIMCLLDVEDILTLRMSCKHLYSLTRLRYVWHSALHRHVVNAGLPVPSPRSICGARYRFASSFDLEVRAVHATRLHSNLISDDPQIKRAVQLQTSAIHELDEPLPRSLTSVRNIVFFDGSHGQHYLVAAFSKDCLGCWEISPDSGNIFHVAQWQSLHGSITAVVVNEHNFDPEYGSSHGTLAVASSGDTGLRVMILVLDKFRGRFVELGSVVNPNSSSLRAFRGDLLAFSEDTRVMHWKDGFSCKLYGQSAMMGIATLAMHFIDNNFLIAISYTGVELFLVPNAQAPLTHSLTHPTASFDLLFPAYEATLSGYYPQPHGAPMSETGQIRRHPISLLLRSQDSGYDVVHHYVFELEPHQLDGSPPPCPVRFPPTYIRTVHVSPSCGNMYLSPSGRGYWLETKNVGSKRRSYPARCVIPLCITSTSTQDFSPALPEEWRVDLKVGTRHLYERQCGLKDLKDGKQSVSAVALDDSVGRMGIGDVDGGIVVLDFA